MARIDIRRASSRISSSSSGFIGDLLKRGQDLPAARLKDAPLGVGKTGEVQGRKLPQRVLERVELRGDPGGRRPQRRTALLGHRWLGAPGVAKERLAGGRVRGAPICRQERLRLARGEGMAVDGVAQALLLGAAKGAQRQGDRQREPAAVEARGEFGSELPRERQPSLDPERLAPQELGDGGLGEPVVVAQRGRHARLVHGAGGLVGRVGGKERRLHRGGAPGRLDDDGDFRLPFGAPGGQALETVEDLEHVSGDRDAEREEPERRVGVAPFSAERGERGLESVDGDVENQAHLTSSTGRIWKSGYRYAMSPLETRP
jgi:hypothetical protein